MGARRSTASRPTALRMLKYAFNLIDDGLVGQQLFAGEATRLAYGTDEAAEGRDAFLEKRRPDWSRLPLLLLNQRVCPGQRGSRASQSASSPQKFQEPQHDAACGAARAISAVAHRWL